MDSGQWPVASCGVGSVVTRYSGAANEHQERNSVRAAYVHKAEHLEARKAMMQWWSDYLDVCREGYVAPYIYARQHKAA